MMAFKNKVLFSNSRYNQLLGDTACPRQAYYAWYRMWNGWWYNNRQPDPKSEKAYVAKFFQTEAQWTGTIVHNQAEWALKEAKKKNLRYAPHEELKDFMINRALREVQSGLKEARHKGAYKVKGTVRLLQIELGRDVDEDWIRDRVTSRMTALLSNEWSGPFKKPVNLFLRAIKNPDRIVSVEELATFTHGGIECVIKMDLQTRTSNDPNSCFITDWKTGLRKDSDKDQVIGYSVWARKKGWKIAGTLLAYLGNETADVELVEVEDHKADFEFSEKVFRFVDAVKDRIVDRDVEKNVPIEDRWEPTTDIKVCLSCPFQIICEQDGTKPNG